MDSELIAAINTTPKVAPVTIHSGAQTAAQLIEVVAEKGTASLRRFDISSGAVTPITHGNQEVITFTATPARQDGCARR